VIKHNGAVWGCGTDEDTTYTAGAGLSLAGTAFGIADDGVTTPRIADAAVTTAKLATGAVASAQIADGAIALQDIGANGCLASQVMKWNGSAWACAADSDGGGDITAVNAGAGLTGGAIAGAATLAVGFGGSGAASTVSRSDHNHIGQSWVGGANVALQVTTTGTTGLLGRTDSVANGARGVLGIASSSAGQVFGVQGRSSSSVGYGVLGESLATASATSPGPYATGVFGRGIFGVGGESSNPNGVGVYGFATSTPGNPVGVYGSGGGVGVWGVALSTSARAGFFDGDVEVTGVLSRPAEEQTIDHPLDPENKYLQLSGVASPDMKNVLDGVVRTDASGYAVVSLPGWFEAAHTDFRYQLTVLDESDEPGFAQAKVVRKITAGHFTVRASAPDVEVSWQVTGIRTDPFARRHRTVVEREKPPAERGTYLHPEAWGQPHSKRPVIRRPLVRKED
jgi:hypothetical protein